MMFEIKDKSMSFIIRYVFALCTIVNMSVWRADAQNNREIPLSLESVFPNDYLDKVYLQYPIDMDVKDSLLFILDYGANEVRVFDYDGIYQLSFGGTGAGPGELANPASMAIDIINGDVFVADVNNNRINRYNNKGRFISTFKSQLIQGDLALFGEMLLSTLASRGAASLIENKSALLINTSKDGEFINAYGSQLDIVEGLLPPASKSKLSVHADRVYVLNVYYPNLKIYDSEGTLLQEVLFPEKKDEYQSMVPNNYKWEDFTDPKKTTLPFRFLFKAIDVTDHGIFVGLFHEDVIIDQYTLDGKFTRRYRYKLDSDTRTILMDFEVIDYSDTGAVTISAILVGEEANVHIYHANIEN